MVMIKYQNDEDLDLIKALADELNLRQVGEQSSWYQFALFLHKEVDVVNKMVNEF